MVESTAWIIFFTWGIAGLLANARIQGDELQVRLSPNDLPRTAISGPLIWLAVLAFWLSR